MQQRRRPRQALCLQRAVQRQETQQAQLAAQPGGAAARGLALFSPTMRKSTGRAGQPRIDWQRQRLPLLLELAEEGVAAARSGGESLLAKLTWAGQSGCSDGAICEALPQALSGAA